MNPWMQMALSLGAGAGLGMVHGLLEPLGRRHRNLADGIFVLCCGWVWVQVCFGAFGGDLPPACIPAAAAAGIRLHRTACGKLKPLFRRFRQFFPGFSPIFRRQNKKI